MTEVNKRNPNSNNLNDEALFKQNSRTTAVHKNNKNSNLNAANGNDPNESIDVLNDKNKRQQMKNAFEG